MKTKIVLLAIAGFCSTHLLAQQMTVTADRTTFGVRAGVNFQNINGKESDGDNLENKLATGFHAGVNAEIPVGSGAYIQPGILYSSKGAKWAGTDSKVKLSYIEVPVNFVYKPLLGKGNLLLGFGPYAALGVGGSIDDNGTKKDIDFSADYRSNDRSTQFKRFDAGGNLLAGYEFANRLSVQLNAQLGLVNSNKEAPNQNDESRWRNTGWGVSVGYRL